MCDTFTVFYAFLEIILLVCELSAWSFMEKKSSLAYILCTFGYCIYLKEKRAKQKKIKWEAWKR